MEGKVLKLCVGLTEMVGRGNALHDRLLWNVDTRHAALCGWVAPTFPSDPHPARCFVLCSC
eukprot:4463643-Amphidinium_carterae.1